MKKNIYIFLIITLLLLSSCSSKKYAGTWYNIDNPDDSLIITEDDTYSWGSIGGTVSEYDDGVVLTESEEFAETHTLSFSSFEGETSLVTEQGYTYIKDHDKAVEYHEEQVDKEIERLKDQFVGTWSNSALKVIIRDDGSYDLNNIYSGEKQSGTWKSVRKGEHLHLEVSLEENTFKQSTSNDHHTDPVLRDAYISDSPYPDSDYVLFVGNITLIKESSETEPRSQTLEDILKSDAVAMEEIRQTAEDAGLDVTFSNNNVIYTYDFFGTDGVTEELVKSDKMREELGKALEKNGDVFSGLCSKLQEETNVKGVQVTVIYMYGGEVIVSQSFDDTGRV